MLITTHECLSNDLKRSTFDTKLQQTIISPVDQPVDDVQDQKMIEMGENC